MSVLGRCAQLDLAVVGAHLVSGLREDGRPFDDAATAEVEARSVPWAGDDVAVARALAQWSTEMAARIGVYREFVRKTGLGRDDLRLSAHVLRRTFVTNSWVTGNDIAELAELAGHQRLETTRRYSLRSAADRQAAMDRLVEP